MREDITIRELIEMILKGKWLICIITAASILLSGIYSFFKVVPVYSATATLLANPIKGSDGNLTKGIDEVINSLAKYPDMTIDTYKEQFINYTVLNDTIKELELTDQEGNPIRWDLLAKRIKVDIVNNANLLAVTVNDTNPEKAAKIANALANNFIDYISNNTKQIGEQSISFIEEQLKEEEKKLEEQSKIMQEYLANSHNVEQLKMEVETLYNQINNYDMQLIDVEKQIESDKVALDDVLKMQEDFTGIALDDSVDISIPLNSDEQYIEMNIDSNNKLQKALLTIRTTEIQTRLIQNLAEKESLQSKLKDLKSRLKETQTLLAEEEYKYESIIRNYELAKQAYNAYIDRYNEALVVATSNFGKSALILASPAAIPVEPSNRGKVYYLAMGAIVGFMIGILVAFVVGYWKETDPRKHNHL